MAEDRPHNPCLTAEPAGNAADEQLRAVLEAAVDAIITIDERGLIRSANPATSRMFGYPLGELLGRNVSVLMPEPHRHHHDEYIARFVRTREPRVIGHSLEQVGRRKDGSEFPIELAVTEIGHHRLFTGILRDITDRKAATERLQQADRLASLGTLAAGLGHDMNNILLPLRSRLDVIERAAISPEVRGQLAEIRGLVRYLQDLGDGLHQLVADPGRVSEDLAPVGLQEWWGHAGVLLRRAVSGSVRFKASIEDGLPPVRVARYRLTQAVFNLLINANESIDAGCGGEAELRAIPGPDSTVRLSVHDTGCGMEPGVLRHALEPFFTTKVRRLGTGLGLSIVHTMVRDSGGHLEIESEPGSGTTITMVFPEALRDNPDTDESTPEIRRAVVTTGDPRQTEVIAALLETYGLDVLAGATAPDATTDLWLTEPRPAVLDYLRGAGPRAKIVLLGPPDAVWGGPPCEVVQDPGNFSQLHTTLARALKGLHDEPARHESALRR